MAVAAVAIAAPLAAASRSELVRSGFASRFTELHLHLPGSPNFPPAPVLAGPVLTGSRVVWAEQRAPGVWRIQSAPLRGASRPATSTAYQPRARPTPSGLALAASDERIAVSDVVTHCPPGACDRSGSSHFATGRYGHPLRIIESCASASCGSPCFFAFPFGVTGQIVAYAWTCHTGSGSIRVRDLAPGAARPSYEIPTQATASVVAAAGHYLVWQEESPTVRAVVYDLRRGREVYSIDNPRTVAIQPDGTAVFDGYSFEERAGWASPAEPSPHWIPKPRGGFGFLVGAGHGRAAFMRGLRGSDLESEVVVFDLDGHRLAHSPIRPTLQDPTFDGQRVAIATQSCQTTAIAVWDIRDPRAPLESRKACPAAAPASRTALITPSGRVRVRLRCPHHHRLGCVGRLHLVAFAGGDYAVVGTRTYNIAFDATAGVSTRVSGRARAFLADHPDARIFGSTRAVGRTSVGEYSGHRRAHRFVLGIRKRRG